MVLLLSICAKGIESNRILNLLYNMNEFLQFKISIKIPRERMNFAIIKVIAYFYIFKKANRSTI